MKRKTTTAEPWPPLDMALPDTIEAIEAGRPEPPAPCDHSRAAVLQRLLAIPGVQTADRPPPFILEGVTKP